MSSVPCSSSAASPADSEDGPYGLRKRPLKTYRFTDHRSMVARPSRRRSRRRGAGRGRHRSDRNCSNTAVRSVAHLLFSHLNDIQTNENAIDLDMASTLNEEASDIQLTEESAILVNSVSGDAPDNYRMEGEQ